MVTSNIRSNFGPLDLLPYKDMVIHSNNPQIINIGKRLKILQETAEKIFLTKN